MEGKTIRDGFREEGLFDLGFEECRGVLCEEIGKGRYMHSVKGHGGLGKIYVPRVPNTIDYLLCAMALIFSTIPWGGIIITSHR